MHTPDDNLHSLISHVQGLHLKQPNKSQMDYVPDTDDDYPPPTQALEDRVAYLRKIGALIKAEFYNSDAIEREAAHQAFDVIIERSIFNEQSKFIILQENRALREEVCRITDT